MAGAMHAPQRPAAPAPHAGGGMAPAPGAGAAGGSDAQFKQKAVEGLNIAVQSGMEAVQALAMTGAVNEQTKAKLEQGISLLAQAKEEIEAPAAPPQGGGSGAGTAEG